MRERQLRTIQSTGTPGITPAYAGKTKMQQFKVQQYQDHPRVCGKDASCAVGSSWVLGSPPRMRERLEQADKNKGNLGITPAYAGKTVIILIIPFVLRDHPRVCGKDLLRSLGAVFLVGSPPRMRERHLKIPIK